MKSHAFRTAISLLEITAPAEAKPGAAPASAAHIHVAARNAAGPVVIPLNVGSGTDWTVETCSTEDPAILAAIGASPGDYYVNVHNADFPGGEVRGQLK
ncbi:CHRD domain containing protein [Arthrobacter sp. Hiyo4]|nr:CHRD domain containing protein [Arthrobacter sp. Hiyo4]